MVLCQTLHKQQPYNLEKSYIRLEMTQGQQILIYYQLLMAIQPARATSTGPVMFRWN